jgi:hypothetical protein
VGLGSAAGQQSRGPERKDEPAGSHESYPITPG